MASLKILEVDKNKLEDLPRSLAKLKQLEVLNISSNCLQDLGPVNEILTLTSLNASGNKLTSVQLPFAKMPRLQMLSASDNPITELDPDIGQIQAAVTINFSDCQLKSVPGQIGEIKAKKLQVLSFMGNPLKDNRLKKIMKGVEEGNKPMKELLNYLKKQPKVSNSATCQITECGVVGEATGQASPQKESSASCSTGIRRSSEGIAPLWHH